MARPSRVLTLFYVSMIELHLSAGSTRRLNWKEQVLNQSVNTMFHKNINIK
jgi:hypothetical protein